MNPEELKRLLDADKAASGLRDCMGATLALGLFLRNNAPAILALVEENARLRGHTKAMIHLCQDAGVADDLVAQLFPDAKRKNGQPASDFAKRARRTINEAKAALGEPK